MELGMRVLDEWRDDSAYAYRRKTVDVLVAMPRYWHGCLRSLGRGRVAQGFEAIADRMNGALPELETRINDALEAELEGTRRLFWQYPDAFETSSYTYRLVPKASVSRFRAFTRASLSDVLGAAVWMDPSLPELVIRHTYVPLGREMRRIRATQAA